MSIDCWENMKIIWKRKSIAAANTSKSWVMKRLLSTSLSSFTLGVLHITSSNTHHPGGMECLSYKIKSCAQSLVGSLEIIGDTGEGKHIEWTDAGPLCLESDVFVHVPPSSNKKISSLSSWWNYMPPNSWHTISFRFIYLFNYFLIHSRFCVTCHWLWVWARVYSIATPEVQCRWVCWSKLFKIAG